MPATTVYSRILVKAAELLGGRSRLSRRLQVPRDALDAWIEERSVPPLPVFLEAVDIVMAELDIPGSDPGEPAPSQDCSSPGASFLRS